MDWVWLLRLFAWINLAWVPFDLFVDDNATWALQDLGLAIGARLLAEWLQSKKAPVKQ